VLPVLFFGIISIINVIVFAKDNDFLASLPVSGVSIFLAKLFMVYLDEFIVCAMFFLPTTITLGVVSGASAQFFVFLHVIPYIRITIKRHIYETIFPDPVIIHDACGLNHGPGLPIMAPKKRHFTGRNQDCVQL
jgi:hypothetical protein